MDFEKSKNLSKQKIGSYLKQHNLKFMIFKWLHIHSQLKLELVRIFNNFRWDKNMKKSIVGGIKKNCPTNTFEFFQNFLKLQKILL